MGDCSPMQSLSNKQAACVAHDLQHTADHYHLTAVYVYHLSIHVQGVILKPCIDADISVSASTVSWFALPFLDVNASVACVTWQATKIRYLNVIIWSIKLRACMSPLARIVPMPES